MVKKSDAYTHKKKNRKIQSSPNQKHIYNIAAHIMEQQKMTDPIMIIIIIIKKICPRWLSSWM